MQILIAALSLGLFAQDPGPPSPPPAAAEQPAVVVDATARKHRLPAGTELEVELVDSIGSKTSKLGDRFVIRLSAPIVRDGVELVAAGATGEAEVIDVARAGMGGKQGKLIVSARHLNLNGQSARVRGMSLLRAGESQVGLATAALIVPYAAPLTFVIRGGEIEIPAGTRAKVRLAQDIDLTTPSKDTTGGETK